MMHGLTNVKFTRYRIQVFFTEYLFSNNFKLYTFLWTRTKFHTHTESAILSFCVFWVFKFLR